MTPLSRMVAWHDGTGAAIIAGVLLSAIALGVGWLVAGDHWPVFLAVPLVGAITVIGKYRAVRTQRRK